MSTYRIVTDATQDLPHAVVEKLGVTVVPMDFDLDGQSYRHYADERELSVEAFYEKLRAGAPAVTSQINPVVYEEVLEPILSEGQDVLYIAFSSGLSGTVNNARMAVQTLGERYPERKIVVIDSLCASIGEGLLVYHAARKQQEGMSFEALCTWVEEHKGRVAHWFTVDDLNHLKRGGRLSAVEAIVGTALNIKPVLSVDAEGRLEVKAKVRGSRKALEHVVGRLKEAGEAHKGQPVIIGHADNMADAQILADMVRETGLVGEVLFAKIGPIIGTHTGAGMTALTFLQ